MFNFRKEFRNALLLTALVLAPSAQQAWAGDLSAQQIIDGLKPARVTRTLSGAAQPAKANPAEIAIINRIRTRSLSSADRAQVAEIAKQKPAIDLEIYFDFNSAAVTPQAEPQLNKLGQALTSSDLTGSVMLLGGHTDAKGGDAYNQSLSQRRAETVKRFLVEHYHIPAENLMAAGYGKKDLKNAADALAPENRRVQIVNMARQDQAHN